MLDHKQQKPSQENRCAVCGQPATNHLHKNKVIKSCTCGYIQIVGHTRPAAIKVVRS